MIANSFHIVLALTVSAAARECLPLNLERILANSLLILFFSCSLDLPGNRLVFSNDFNFKYNYVVNQKFQVTQLSRVSQKQLLLLGHVLQPSNLRNFFGNI